MIKNAIGFIMDNVIEPALNSNKLDQSYKYKVQNSKRWIQNFKRVGDLYKYLRRFNNSHGAGEDLYNEFKSIGLKTFEDIFPVFKAKFHSKIEDITVIDDFIIGNIYSSYDIGIFSETYSLQQGIYLIGKEPNYNAIFIKATLKNGDYPNEWIVKNEILKYYMYGPKGKYDPSYKYNKAIINSGNTPIYVFIKRGTECTLNGIYKYLEYDIKNDNSKWFKLRKINSLNTNQPMTKEEYDSELQKKVEQSQITDKNKRQKRLKEVNDKPQTIKITVKEYIRNPDVIAEVKERANGICEMCGKKAPFNRKTDGTPYLEIHHVVPLSEGGKDNIDNTIAVCPNCHRKAHYG